MSKPAFLVEGKMEQLIIQRICPGKPVRLIGCNGDSVSMGAVSRALNALMRLLKSFHPVVIILDRERRAETCEELIKELSDLMDKSGHQGRYIIGCQIEPLRIGFCQTGPMCVVVIRDITRLRVAPTIAMGNRRSGN